MKSFNNLERTNEACSGQVAMPLREEEVVRFGIDIRSKKFWQDSLKVIGQKIDRYCKL